MTGTDPNALRHDEDEARRKSAGAIDDARDAAIIETVKAEYRNTPAYILVPDSGPPKVGPAPRERPPDHGPEFPSGHQPVRRMPVYRR
jgi:hypothetical protein